jgi:probable rRNA maturation factor
VTTVATAPDLRLDIQYALPRRGLPKAGDFRRWAAAVPLDGPCEAALRIVDEDEGAELNRQWRGKPNATNVLSFPSDAPPSPRSSRRHLGDIVICAPVVAREAMAQGKPEAAHWAHLLIHGLLHLQGYDHVTAKQAKIMEALETEILARLGYPDPYA